MRARSVNTQLFFAAAAAVALCGLWVPGASAAPLFQGLGDLPGGSFNSRAHAVSADGSVVVGASDSGSTDEAFRWTRSGGMQPLAGGANSHAYGVNSDGSAIAGDVTGQAFRWTSAGGMQNLRQDLDGPLTSVARAVSANGALVAGTRDWIDGYEAFRWSSTTGMRGLGELSGGEYYSIANGISASGSVVVGISGSASGPEAFRWTIAGMQGLGDLPGGDFSSAAFAVSADGAVVVGHSLSADWWEAFRWTSSGGMQPLGSLSSTFVDSTANAVSGDGSIVVGVSASVGASSEAFIWDAAHGMRSLKQVLVTDYGMDLSGWVLLEAYGISADGQTIVGQGLNPSSQFEAWIAVIPEPTGVALLASTGIFSLLRSRRRCR